MAAGSDAPGKKAGTVSQLHASASCKQSALASALQCNDAPVTR